ncbi:MAG: transporter substrate-binding domain-containing protein [Bacteroidales bacterium]
MGKKIQISSYLVLLLLTLFAMYMLKDCRHYNVQVDRLRGDSLNVAIEYSPISLYMKNDTLYGFNYDLIKELSIQGGFDIKFHPIVNIKSGLLGINSGSYDILLAQIPITAEMRNKYLFTEPIYLDKQVLVQRIDSLGDVVVKSQLDLADKTVYVISGTSTQERINSLAQEIGETIHIVSKHKFGQRELFNMVADSIIDYAIINEKSAQRLSNDITNVDFKMDISFTQFQSWVINPQDTLLCDSINILIKRIKETPRYEEIYNRYFIQ